MNKKQEFVYKVVDQEEYSIAVWGYGVKYELNKETLPHPDLTDSKLFVFKRYKDAQEFVFKRYKDAKEFGYKIFRCEYGGKLVKMELYVETGKDPARFWDKYNMGTLEVKKENGLYPFPEGTYLVDSVIPRKMLLWIR